MVSYLLKLLYLVCFSLIIIITYYTWEFSFHQESFTWYIPYVLSIIFFYFIYKSIQYISWKETIIFTPLKIFWYFLLQLLILSILFFSLNWDSWWFWFTLFFKILWFLFIPTLIIFSSISFWKFLLNKITWFLNETKIFQFLFSLWIWFLIFSTSLILLWFAWFYNLFSVFWIISIMILISNKEFFEILESIFSYKIEIKSHFKDWDIFSKINLYLLSSEFLFIVISFLISVNFINIVRPMPIWWDDLWVYMNYPNLMATSWQILPLWMIPWQVFTWIWYMFWSATQSFFLNNVGWILSLLVIILSLTDLLKSKSKTFINIPFLAWVIFLSMPMIIFQQAKDMKLDTWLFFISSIVVYLVIYIFTKYIWYTEEEIKKWNLEILNDSDKNSQNLFINYKNKFFNYFLKYTHIWETDIFNNKSYLIYLFLIWILAWFAFSIKITSLLLISWILWIFFYSKLWIAWFISYLSIYVWIFTKAWFWDMMFVVYPKDDMDFRNKFFIYSLLLWIILLIYSIYKYNFKSFKNLLILSLMFLIWVWIWFSPWWIRNIISLNWEFSISWLLNWKQEWFVLDYTKIYTKNQIDEINKKNDISLTVNSSWITTNEDMGRYFGYEKWINNYIKLPYNLTMQSNQRWEYTDITFIYLAIIPVIVLFLAFKFELLSLWLFILSLIPLWLFFNNEINVKLTNFFSKFELPYWYIIIALFFFIPFIYLMYSLNKEKHSVIFKLNLVFALFYIFLWTISAFWIVWYWITMYYSLLLIISIWVYYVTKYDDDDYLKVKIIKSLWSIIILIIIWTYIFNSTFPHWFSNLKTASYKDFKAWIKDNYTSIIDSHSDYYNVLIELNINPEKRDDLFKYIFWTIKNEELKNILVKNNINDLIRLNLALVELSNIQDETWSNLKLVSLKKEVNKIRSELYKNILYPKKEFKNQIWIYRIWTFLKYFISDNHKRLLDDSLIFEFNKFFYDQNNIDLSIDRMKKIWVNYFLVDLNAATIDRDPRRDLTKRYERLLYTFTSTKLELYQSDSICLKIALEDYNKSNKTKDSLTRYMNFAWVNYESYTENWEVINRWIKQIECYNYILNLIKDKKINENNYSYLLPIADYLEKNKIKSQDDLLNFFKNHVNHGWFALFKIK